MFFWQTRIIRVQVQVIGASDVVKCLCRLHKALVHIMCTHRWKYAGSNAQYYDYVVIHVVVCPQSQLQITKYKTGRTQGGCITGLILTTGQLKMRHKTERRLRVRESKRGCLGWLMGALQLLAACPLTIIAVCQDGDFSSRELGSHLAAHGHAEADIEALLLLVQRVVDDNDATELLPLVLVKAQHTGVILRSGDVIGVGQHRGGYGAGGSDWGNEAKREDLFWNFSSYCEAYTWRDIDLKKKTHANVIIQEYQ